MNINILYIMYKIRLSIVMSVCIRQHLSNISSLIYEKVNLHWLWVEVEKKVFYKNACTSLLHFLWFTLFSSFCTSVSVKNAFVSEITFKISRNSSKMISWDKYEKICEIVFWEKFSLVLKSGSHLAKNVCYLLAWKYFKNDENCFLFHLSAVFVLKIFKFLSRRFGDVGKTAW